MREKLPSAHTADREARIQKIDVQVEKLEKEKADLLPFFVEALGTAAAYGEALGIKPEDWASVFRAPVCYQYIKANRPAFDDRIAELKKANPGLEDPIAARISRLEAERANLRRERQLEKTRAQKVAVAG